MFDVTDKRAVDRLAAIVAMLEGQEREARETYKRAQQRILDNDHATESPMNDAQLRSAHLALAHASGRHDQAQSALAAARELATDR